MSEIKNLSSKNTSGVSLIRQGYSISEFSESQKEIEQKAKLLKGIYDSVIVFHNISDKAPHYKDEWYIYVK